MKNKIDRKIKLIDFVLDPNSQIYVKPKNIEINSNTFHYSDGDKTEDYILQSLRGVQDLSDGSDELRKYIKNWPTLYHLGNGRSNILKSLELPSNLSVLELGCGCGAISRYLGENYETVDCIEGSFARAKIAGERCRDLDNVRVYCSDMKLVEFEDKYDLVTIIGVLEYASVFFSNEKDPLSYMINIAKRALKSNGILVIAIENKIGLKYWAGSPEDHTGNYYENIIGYPNPGTPITLSRREIKDLLLQSNFDHIYFFHCFPDYKFSTEIFSDIGDENEFFLYNWIETPFRNFSKRFKRNFHEGLAVRSLCKAGLLRDLANSLLIVSTNSSASFKEPSWIIKRFSLNRSKEFRCITTLKYKDSPQIEKIRAYNPSKSKVKKILKLGSTKFNLIHQTQNSSWKRGDLLIYNLYEGVFSQNFTLIAKNILKKWYNTLLEHFFTNEHDSEGYPLLEGKSFDFLIRNCLINKNRYLVPIDSEWIVKESIPADLVVYRCVQIDILKVAKNIPHSKIKWNVDKFTLEFIRFIFPKYGKRRHSRNKSLEKEFQLIVGSKYYEFGSISNVFNKKVIKYPLKVFPSSIKNFLIKYFLF